MCHYCIQCAISPPRASNPRIKQKIFYGNSLVSTSMVLVWMHFRGSTVNDESLWGSFFCTTWKSNAFQRYLNMRAPRLPETLVTHSITTRYRHSNKTRSTLTYGCHEGKALVTCTREYVFTSVSVSFVVENGNYIACKQVHSIESLRTSCCIRMHSDVFRALRGAIRITHMEVSYPRSTLLTGFLFPSQKYDE
jgi:hypothetical protein